jgi:hypothetical protein
VTNTARWTRISPDGGISAINTGDGRDRLPHTSAASCDRVAADWGGRMSTAKRLAWIAGGYAVAVGAGFAAVAVNELFMAEDVAQGSPGMVAFGDMILFVLATGIVGLIPTLFLLTPRARAARGDQ